MCTILQWSQWQKVQVTIHVARGSSHIQTTQCCPRKSSESCRYDSFATTLVYFAFFTKIKKTWPKLPLNLLFYLKKYGLQNKWVRIRKFVCAGQVLESGSWGGSGGSTPSGRSKESSRTPPPRHPPSPSLSHHQPFLSLVLTCLKGQDDQREGLLTSLHSQLSQCLSITKDVSTHTFSHVSLK